MGRCKPLDSLNLFLSYASQLSGAKSCFLVHRCFLHSSSAIAMGDNSIHWISVLGPSFIFGGMQSWWLWHFLYILWQELPHLLSSSLEGQSSSFSFQTLMVPLKNLPTPIIAARWRVMEKRALASTQEGPIAHLSRVLVAYEPETCPLEFRDDIERIFSKKFPVATWPK